MTCMLEIWETLNIRRRTTARAFEAVCRGCRAKGHYKKVCMKKATHLVGVQDDSDPEYYDELGEAVCAQMHTWYMHQPGEQEETPHPISHQRWTAESEETGKDPLSYCGAKGWYQGRCKPTQLIKLWQDNWWQIATPTLNTLDRSIQEIHGIHVLGKFHTLLRWKGRVYKQLFYVTSANASPNLLSRDACYMLGVLKLCYSVKTVKSSSAQTPNARYKWPTFDKQWNKQGEAIRFLKTIDLQEATSRSTIEESGHP